MSIKFRLKGLAETFIDKITCPSCKRNSFDDGEQNFETDLSRVTLEGIVVVARCSFCGNVFIPDEQRRGVINSQKLRNAVERDSVNTGEPLYKNPQSVALEVERLNAEINDKVH